MSIMQPPFNSHYMKLKEIISGNSKTDELRNRIQAKLQLVYRFFHVGVQSKE